MVDFDKSPWKYLHPDLSLYRYESQRFTPVLSQTPILMLHGPMTSHRTWDTLGYYLWDNGFDDVYAVDIADVQMGALPSHMITYLDEIVNWILDQYPPTTPLILIGHSTGGVLARRYIRKSPNGHRVAYLFTLGSPHPQTFFAHTVYVPPEHMQHDVTSTGRTYVMGSDKGQNTFIVNMYGNSVGPSFDGIVQGVHLPEAINIVLPLGHSHLKTHERVMDEILACLRGERYRVQMYLQSLYMKDPDIDNIVGPFYFEVDGVRCPSEGMFQAEAEHEYTFTETPPLATLVFPAGQTLASTIFRLKDHSRARPVRRRLFAKLLISLRDDDSAIHELQDNQGSKIALRLHSQRFPRIL